MRRHRSHAFVTRGRIRLLPQVGAASKHRSQHLRMRTSVVLVKAEAALARKGVVDHDLPITVSVPS
jgi:hypothetical protein